MSLAQAHLSLPQQGMAGKGEAAQKVWGRSGVTFGEGDFRAVLRERAVEESIQHLCVCGRDGEEMLEGRCLPWVGIKWQQLVFHQQDVVPGLPDPSYKEVLQAPIRPSWSSGSGQCLRLA